MRRQGSSVRVVVAAACALLGAAVAAEGAVGAPARASCAPARAEGFRGHAIMRALRGRRDVWGERLISNGGATYAAVRPRLAPLFLARGPRGRRVTATGAHYLALAMPRGGYGAGAVALHVADGSEVVAERTTGPRLGVFVGPGGRERFGGCRSRLAEPSLHEGYLPILRTRYRDAAGVRYAQESFAAHVPETRSLVSFVRITADATAPGARRARIRLDPSVRVTARPGRLVRGGRTHLFFERGGRYRRSAVEYDVVPGTTRTVHAAWLAYPQRSAAMEPGPAPHEAARASVERYWLKRLATGASIEVPERKVMDAARNLLIQNLNHLWRYSIGNQYEQFSYGESAAASQVLGELGFAAESERIMRTGLTRPLRHTPNRKMGEALVGSARAWELFHNGDYVRHATPTLARHLDRIARQLDRSPVGLLARERFSNDVHDPVHGLHTQAPVWQGLNGMARVWAATGHPRLAARSRLLAARLGRGLRRAVAGSQRRLPDGSLFVPMRLRDGERPYATVTQSRRGSYWNLVAPRAFSSGLFPRGSAQARGALAYLERHGAWLLGLVRAGAFSLYGRDRSFPTGGTVQVYGVETARVLAANGAAERLALGLYGHLGAGMHPTTFVSGEAASVAPLRGRAFRSMYLPPNATSNAAFLVTLRLLLVNEMRDGRGAPVGLELAHATPRHWLQPGGRVAVRSRPPAFGPVGFSLEADEGAVRGVLELPATAPRRVTIRVRLPRSSRIERVAVDGLPHAAFDPATGTIDLSGRSGRVELEVASVQAIARAPSEARTRVSRQ